MSNLFQKIEGTQSHYIRLRRGNTRRPAYPDRLDGDQTILVARRVFRADACRRVGRREGRRAVTFSTGTVLPARAALSGGAIRQETAKTAGIRGSAAGGANGGGGSPSRTDIAGAGGMSMASGTCGSFMTG